MRWSRIGLYTLVGMVAVLLTAIMVLISVDLGMFKNRVESLVTDLLGREFRIDGEMHAYVGMSLELNAEDVYLANPAWADSEAFVAASKIEIAVDTWSLVKGPVEIERIEIDGVRINLEKNDAGDASWIFAGLQTEFDGEVDETAPRARLPIILGYAGISDTRVSYKSPGMAEPLLFIVEALKSNFAADVFSLELTGSLNGTPVHFVKTTSPIENLLAYENVTVELSGNVGEITFDSSAQIDDLLTPRRPGLVMNIQGPGAGYLTDVLAIQSVTSGPLELSVSIAESGEQMIASLAGVFGEFEFAVNGRFQDLQELHDVDLEFSADGPDIGTLIRLSGHDYADVDPFDIRGRISRSGPEITIDNVLVAIGASNLKIDGFFGEFPTVKGGRLALEASGPDYGRFVRLFGLPGYLDGEFVVSVNATPSGDGSERVEIAVTTPDIGIKLESLVSVEKNFDGTTLQMDIAGPSVGAIASALGVDGLPAEEFRISASAEKDATGILIRSLAATVGDEVFEMTGHIGDKPLAGATSFEIDFSGSDLGASIAALGRRADNLPKGGYYLRGRVQTEDDKLWLRDINAVIGDAEEYVFQLSGFLTTNKEFVDSEINFRARGASLAALGELVGLDEIPDLPFDLEADFRRGLANTYIDDGTFTSGRVVVGFSGAFGDKPLEDNLSLIIEASVPEFGDVISKFGVDVDVLPVGDLVASARVQQKNREMSLEQLDVSFGDARLQISGDIGQLPSLAGTKLKFELAGDDFSRLVPPGMSRESLAHEYSASGSVSLSEGELEIKRFRANVGHTTVAGDFVFALEPFFDSGSFTLKADSPDVFQLLPRLRDVSVPQVAKLRYRGGGSWADNFWSFDKSRLELGEGYIEINGSLDGPPSFERTDMEVEWVVASVNNLSVLAGRELPDHPLRLKARFLGTRDVMTMEDFEFTFGESDLDGQFTMRAGEVPVIEIDVTSELFDISDYMTEPEVEQQRVATVVDDKVIPDTPLPLELLHSFDADVDIAIDELRTGSLQLFGLDLDAVVSDGGLKIENFSYTNRSGGSLTLSADLMPDESGGADFSLAADGKDLVMGVRVGSEEELQQLPLLQVRADLDANGETVRDLAGSVDGYVRVAGGAGLIPSGSLTFLTQDFVTELVSTINPFSKSDPYTSVECTVILLHFNDGVLDSDPVLVQQTDKLRIFASTNIDFKTETLDANFKVVPRKGLGLSLSSIVNPYVKITGTLSKPSLVIDPEGILIEGGLAVATAGISLLAKSFKDRFLSEKDPCGNALAEADERVAAQKSEE